jgi:hypothetical protein
MKNTIQILIALVFSLCALAEDAPTYLYRGEVAGVMCSACSGRVKAALSQIRGVKEVKITLGKDGALQPGDRRGGGGRPVSLHHA